MDDMGLLHKIAHVEYEGWSGLLNDSGIHGAATATVDGIEKVAEIEKEGWTGIITDTAHGVEKVAEIEKLGWEGIIGDTANGIESLFGLSGYRNSGDRVWGENIFSHEFDPNHPYFHFFGMTEYTVYNWSMGFSSGFLAKDVEKELH